MKYFKRLILLFRMVQECIFQNDYKKKKLKNSGNASLNTSLKL